MEDGEEDRAFDLELVASPVEKLLDDVLTAGLLPESLEDQSGSVALSGDGGDLSPGVSGEDQDGMSEASARDEEGIVCTVLLKRFSTIWR